MEFIRRKLVSYDYVADVLQNESKFQLSIAESEMSANFEHLYELKRKFTCVARKLCYKLH